MDLRRAAQSASPLPEKIGSLIQESRWLAIGAVALFLSLALWGYDKADPGWSHAVGDSGPLHNPAGRAGAWLADLMLYLFGLSAWWWVALLFMFVWWGYRRLNSDSDEPGRGRRHLLLAMAGFLILLVTSSALEALRFYSLQAELPLAPGGMIGTELGYGLARYLGFTITTLVLLGFIALGWSFFAGMPWLLAFERLGTLLEGMVELVLDSVDRWKDRRIGREVAQRREENVQEEKKRIEVQAPAAGPERIEPREPAMAMERIEPLEAAAGSDPIGFREPVFIDPPPGPAQPAFIDSPLEPAQPAFIDPSPEPAPPAFIESPPAPAQPAFLRAEKAVEREKPAPAPEPAAGSASPPGFPVGSAEGRLPPLQLLDPAPPAQETVGADTLEFTSRLIERKLADFGVKVKVLAALPGPVITRYEIEPAVGVKGAQIVNLARDLARSLALISVRVVETVPGKSCMALELPNPKRQMVKLSEIISSRAYHDMSSPLTVSLGKDISGQPVVTDLAKTPHLLVAGTTGSGKSVGVNAMILSLVYKSEPEQVRLIMVDPKMLELSIYEGIPHLLAPVVTDMKQAANALNWCVGEMEKRYKLMSAMGVRNVAGFNAKIRDAGKRGEHIPNPLSLTPEAPEPLTTLPFIVVIIDELADLMMVVGKKVEELIARLAQKARAAGIHLVLATQRPSVDVITGLIKANIPTRLSFQVSSKIDSRTILDQMGAEALLGQGDMLYLAPGTGYPTRVHGAFVSDDEVHRVVEYLKTTGAPEYVEDILSGSAEDEEGGGGGDGDSGDAENDPLYDQAVEVVLKNRRASISLVQRHLRIGYNRSARLIEAMEKSGLVSAMDGRGGREVLARKPEEQ